MEQGGPVVVDCVLAALYLRGGPLAGRSPRRNWGLVRDALARSLPSLSEAPDALQECGLWDEAALIAEPTAREWGLVQVERERVLSVQSPNYPSRWLRVLGHQSPPCLWVRGAPPSVPSSAVVGTRDADRAAAAFAREAAQAVMASGRSLVSGGAVGVDTLAETAALDAGGQGRTLVVLPYGLRWSKAAHGVCQVSVCEPGAAFTTAQAMERNVLIYASSALSVVVRPRYRAGGTWHGAVEALRRRLSHLAVWSEPEDRASKALCRLGGTTIAAVDEIPGLADWAEAEEGTLLDHTG